MKHRINRSYGLMKRYNASKIMLDTIVCMVVLSGNRENYAHTCYTFQQLFGNLPNKGNWE